MKKIRTILFDFDGTLVFQRPDILEVLGAFCAEIGQPLSAEAEQQLRRSRHHYFADSALRSRRAGLTPDQFWPHFNHHLLEAGAIHGDLDTLAREVTSRITALQFSHVCPSEVCHTLGELQARGYRLGLLSNRETVERFHSLLDQVDLWPYFDLILAAGEVGISKPAPGIFHAALERMGGAPEESAYVGDNYWADVVGARQAGVTPILLDPYHLFPEAGCLTLARIDELLQWLR